jgi:GT2 family glycosyltransferase
LWSVKKRLWGTTSIVHKERESKESPWKNSFIYNRINNNQQIKKRNENKTHYVSRSIENLENKNRDFNYKNNNHINSVIFENDNLEEENNKDNYNYDFKSDKKSSNRKCYRWSSLDKFCDHKKDSNENIEQNNDYRGIKKIKNIRNFYKQRNVNYSGV